MIEWFTWVQLAVAVAAGLLCLVLGFAGRVPSDLTIGALALVELLLVVQLVVAIAAPGLRQRAHRAACSSSTPTSSAPCCCRPPPRSGRSSSATAGARSCSASRALAVAVMVYRMLQIWTVQQA